MKTLSFLLALLFAAPAFAAADAVIRESVAVCDPNSPSHCAAPDSSGNVPVVTPPSSASASGITPISALNATSNVLKATPGNFYGGYAINRTATAGFLVIYNATAAPAPGALTAALVLGCVPLPGAGVGSINNKPGPPEVYSVGIVMLVTSAANCGTYTTGVITADIFGNAS